MTAPWTHVCPAAAPALLVVVGLAAALIGCGGGHVSVSAEASVTSTVVVFEAPPPTPEVDPGEPPSLAAVWSDGYWSWVDDEFVWVPGQWQAARPGYVWVSPQWRPHGRGFLFVPGRWRRAEAGGSAGD